MDFWRFPRFAPTHEFQATHRTTISPKRANPTRNFRRSKLDTSPTHVTQRQYAFWPLGWKMSASVCCEECLHVPKRRGKTGFSRHYLYFCTTRGTTNKTREQQLTVHGVWGGAGKALLGARRVPLAVSGGWTWVGVTSLSRFCGAGVFASPPKSVVYIAWSIDSLHSSCCTLEEYQIYRCTLSATENLG